MSNSSNVIIRNTRSMSNLDSMEFADEPHLIAPPTVQNLFPTMAMDHHYHVAPPLSTHTNFSQFILSVRDVDVVMEPIKKATVRPKLQSKVHRRRVFFNRTNVVAVASKHRRDSYASLPSCKDIGLVSEAELSTIVGLY
jgi:hypothetical protein